MYTKGDLVGDYTEGAMYAREILDPDGNVICHVIEHRDDQLNGTADAEVLLKHLNRQS